MNQEQRDALREAASKATPGAWCVGAQNDALFLTAGRAPAPSNDYPWHDAPRVALAKMLGAQEGDCLPVNAEANASFIALAHPATVLALLDENERLREALAGISLATQRTDSPSHVIVQQVGREARTALGDGA